MLEKQAVKIGGGMNHRIGLFEMIQLKDNHVDFAGGIENAIDRCHAYLKEKGLDLHSRNAFQIFGKNLDTPVDFVLFYAEETKTISNRNQYSYPE